MLVMKFGGTSVGTSDAMSRTAEIVFNSKEPEKVVVTSAMSGVTDELLNLAKSAIQEDLSDVWPRYEALKFKHEQAIGVLANEDKNEVLASNGYLFLELKKALDGLILLKELTSRTLDLIASFGERLSAPILASALRRRGLKAIALDAREIIFTDDAYTSAEVDFTLTNVAIREKILVKTGQGMVPVVTGFVSRSRDGATTTLGRGGSDYTAAIIGAALNAERIEIWTDVDGIFSADPRLLPAAKILPEVSYSEAIEMSYFGAKVIHPKTMMPAFEAGIPIIIKNTFNPGARGTSIQKEVADKTGGVKAVTSISKVSMVTVQGIGLRGRTGFAAKFFEVAGRNRINILMITQASSEQSICVLVGKDDGLKLQAALKRAFETEIQSKAVENIILDQDVAIVAVVGAGMRGTLGIAGRAFTAVAEAGANILAIAQGSSELNISFVVRSEDTEKSVTAIHKTFIS